MEEVPAHVHLGTIVPDVLSRQHEHRSGLIWRWDHDTCYTNLQCRRFGRNLFQCYSTALSSPVHPKQYWIELIGRLLGVRLSLSHFSEYKVKKEPLEAWILRAFTDSETDDDLILRLWIYFLTHWRTYASRLLREFGSCALPQFIRGY
ncbi:hypothetical protein M9H77_17343 [Catharanthus roseus]|uniref:Uncharacterized protein n=1 Tax=Catharanthus roseus TaxID=4058 RepID=A0ACC0B4A8_CATRO|nr:hypothetical protein M9H77_17343 [Catharanthus roseus]